MCRCITPDDFGCVRLCDLKTSRAALQLLRSFLQPLFLFLRFSTCVCGCVWVWVWVCACACVCGVGFGSGLFCACVQQCRNDCDWRLSDLFLYPPPPESLGMHGGGMCAVVVHTRMQCVSCCLVDGFQGRRRGALAASVHTESLSPQASPHNNVVMVAAVVG